MIPKIWNSISAGDVYDRLMAENVALSQEVHKSRGMRLKGEEGTTPEAARDYFAGYSDCWNQAWARLVGNRRFPTLRPSARAWQKSRDWLFLSSWVPS